MAPKTTTTKSSTPAKTTTTSVGKNVSTLSTKAVQTAVGAKSDGIYGANTTASVKAFQKANNLVADGIVGPKTAAAISKVNSSSVHASSSRGPSTMSSVGGSSKATGSSTTGGGTGIIPNTGGSPDFLKQIGSGLKSFFGNAFSSPSGITPTSGPMVDQPALPTTIVSSNAGAEKARLAKILADAEQKKIDEQKRINEQKDKEKKDLEANKPPDPVPTPDPLKTPENILADMPGEGMQKVFNIYTGEESEIPVGKIPQGFSAQNPVTRTDVRESIVDEFGNTIDKLSDGTYRITDANGNYS